MKSIFYAVVAIIMTSCSKTETRLAAGNNFFYTNASVDAGIIQGVRTTCDVVKFKGADKKSVSITMYLDNGYFIQTGYHTSFGSTLPFTQVWLNGGQPGAQVTLLASPTLSFGQKQSFSIYNVLGTTKWRTTIDGVDCLEIELFTQHGDSPVLYTEMGPVSKPSRFPTLNFYPAIETYVNGVWQSYPSGHVTSSTWGIEGLLQNSSLQPNELNIGSAINFIPSGSLLWQTNL